MHEALYYEKAGNGDVNCLLCPAHCHIMQDKVGACGVRKNMDGILYTENYGRVSALALDSIEKKPLFHFYPGSYILSVSSYGCNLKCKFCQNWELSQEKPDIEELTVDKVIEAAKECRGNIGIAYTYNEPLVWYEFVLDTAKKAKENGLANVLVTNGFIEEQPLIELLPYISAMNVDIKGDNEFYKKICGGNIGSVRKTIARSYGRTHIEVTYLIIPGLNDSESQINDMAKWLSSVDRDIPLHLSRYYPQYKMTRPETPVETMLTARDTAKQYLDYVYIGNVYGTDDGTYCPECHSLLVERGYKKKIVGIKDGQCTNCGHKINMIM